MSRLKHLKTISTKPSFAKSLGVKPVFLTKCLYIDKPEKQYHQFSIDKKSGGKRTISAPSDTLKSLQSALSNLLLDCIDEISNDKFANSQLAKPKMKSTKLEDSAAKILKLRIPSAEIKQPSLSHGFVRNRSIITNAMMHLGKKNVLNIDLRDFFDSFNFGRVRGFFIKNRNFQLDPNIATMIAQIACYENTLPQGSPCSPVITNLITHSLDIRLASLAKKFKCTYSRYADDITFSTRKSIFPHQIMNEEQGNYKSGKKLISEIERAGFCINIHKIRIQYKDSRQEVTGLVVNKKPNVKKEYWRLARAKCNSLFHTGKFTSIVDDKVVDGNINELEGQLNFIDQVDRYNRMRQKPPLKPEYAKKGGKETEHLLSGREKTFSRFLFYRLFYGNEQPTILCEGKTDNVYLKAAISELKKDYPKLAKNGRDSYQLLLRFVEYSKRTRFLLGLFGGTDYLGGFIRHYANRMKFYKAPKPQNPTIIFLDNDSGTDKIVRPLKQEMEKTVKFITKEDKVVKEMSQCDFIHVVDNLYVILTPQGKASCNTDIEYFFDDTARLKKHKNSINFNGFKPLLNRIVQVINHYDQIKLMS